MRLVSFDPLRSLGIPGVTPLKPEQMQDSLELLRAADAVLFPQTWQVNTLHYALGKRLFPSIASYHLGANKVEMTRAFQALVPAHVPETLIVAPTPAGLDAIAARFGFPVVVKELRESMGRGVHLIADRRALLDYADRVDTVYAQELLELDRDLRIVWVGDRVVSAYWRIGGDGFHTNVARGGRIDFDGIPPAALELVARVATALGVDHAGFDVAMVGGHPYLFELNTLFGNEALNQQGLALGPIIADWLARSA
jgi:ribosomal protein S6--L-glutamate ligase